MKKIFLTINLAFVALFFSYSSYADEAVMQGISAKESIAQESSAKESAAQKDTINFIDPSELKNLLDSNNIYLIDVRSTDEFLIRHIDKAKNIPLPILSLDQIDNPEHKKIVLQCESGVRSEKAAIKLKSLSQGLEVFSLTGGIKNWENSNYPIIKGKDSKFPIMRQVQIIAGSLILLGSLLGIFVARSFLFIPLFVGCGLMFAGISGWCGMAKLLALMPWN